MSFCAFCSRWLKLTALPRGGRHLCADGHRRLAPSVRELAFASKMRRSEGGSKRAAAQLRWHTGHLRWHPAHRDCMPAPPFVCGLIRHRPASQTGATFPKGEGTGAYLSLLIFTSNICCSVSTRTRVYHLLQISYRPRNVVVGAGAPTA